MRLFYWATWTGRSGIIAPAGRRAPGWPSAERPDGGHDGLAGDRLRNQAGLHLDVQPEI